MTIAYLYGLTHRPTPAKREPPRYQPDRSAEHHPCACPAGAHTAWLHRDQAGFLAHLREVWR